jgi:hypothetical protein
MNGFLHQLRRAIARSQAPDLVIAILAGALAWFITLLLRTATAKFAGAASALPGFAP